MNEPFYRNPRPPGPLLAELRKVRRGKVQATEREFLAMLVEAVGAKELWLAHAFEVGGMDLCHDDGCPEDDTCSCDGIEQVFDADKALAIAVGEALDRLRAPLAVDPEVKRLRGVIEEIAEKAFSRRPWDNEELADFAWSAIGGVPDWVTEARQRAAKEGR